VCMGLEMKYTAVRSTYGTGYLIIIGLALFVSCDSRGELCAVSNTWYRSDATAVLH
jgi:hypothetical protein